MPSHDKSSNPIAWIEAEQTYIPISNHNALDKPLIFLAKFCHGVKYLIQLKGFVSNYG